MAMARWTRIQLHNAQESAVIKIVADGAMAIPHVGDGRLIPIIICDTRKRPDLAEHVRLHQHLPPGDVKVQWGKRNLFREKITLILSFDRPTEINALIEFEIVKHGPLVEQILAVKGLYLQPGTPGDRVADDPSAAKILIEIPSVDFYPVWEKMFFKSMTKELRRKGVPRHAAKLTATNYIAELRSLAMIRMGMD